MTYWSDDEAASFLSFISARYPVGSPYRWVYTVYLLALNTALRAGEIWGLKVMDVSSDGRKLTNRRQFNRVSLDFGPTKGRKAQVVPCHGDLYRELKLLIDSLKLKADQTIFQNLQGIKTVKEICGHADIATTMNYVHLVSANVERVTEIFVVKPKSPKPQQPELSLIHKA